MRRQLAAIVAGMTATACPKKTTEEPDFNQAAWTGDSTVLIRFIEHTHSGDAPRPGDAPDPTEQIWVTEQCAAADLPENAPDPGGLTDVRVCSSTYADGTAFRNLRAVHRAGEVFLGAQVAEQDWRFHAPKVRVPASFSMGDSWMAFHGGDTNVELRRCQAVPTPFCATGAAAECVTFSEQRVLWVRNHWCPDTGHHGHEGLVVQAGAAPMYSWSSDVHRDDRPQAHLGLEERPFPDAARAHAIAQTLTADHLRTLSPSEARLD